MNRWFFGCFITVLEILEKSKKPLEAIFLLRVDLSKFTLNILIVITPLLFVLGL